MDWFSVPCLTTGYSHSTCSPSSRVLEIFWIRAGAGAPEHGRCCCHCLQAKGGDRGGNSLPCVHIRELGTSAALCWALSSMSMSLLHLGAQHQTQFSRCSLTIAELSGWITFLALLAIICLKQPRILLAFLVARAQFHLFRAFVALIL